MTDTLHELTSLHDEAERLATAALAAQQARNALITWAVEHDNVTIRQIARQLDLSESRVHAIVKARRGG